VQGENSRKNRALNPEPSDTRSRQDAGAFLPLRVGGVCEADGRCQAKFRPGEVSRSTILGFMGASTSNIGCTLGHEPRSSTFVDNQQLRTRFMARSRGWSSINVVDRAFSLVMVGAGRPGRWPRLVWVGPLASRVRIPRLARVRFSRQVHASSDCVALKVVRVKKIRANRELADMPFASVQRVVDLVSAFPLYAFRFFPFGCGFATLCLRALIVQYKDTIPPT